MYVGVFKRFGALLLDLIIIIGLYLSTLFIVQYLLVIPQENTLLSLLSSIIKNPSDALNKNLQYLSAYYLFGALTWLIYETLFVSSRFSGTPGKVVLGMEIACYNNANFFKAFIRSFIKVISIFSVIGLFIEASVISNHRNSQSLHDIAPSTLVRNKVSKGIVESKNIEMIFSDLEEGRLKSFEDIMDLKSRLADNKLSVKQNYGLVVSWILIALTFLASVLFIMAYCLEIKNL